MSGDDGTVYLEFTAQAGLLRCVAVDAATGVEVTVFGPASTARADLERLALRKLKRRLEREAPDKLS